MTAKRKQRQRCTPPTASRQGHVASACRAMAGGPGQRKQGARNPDLISKAVHLPARAVHLRARSVHKRARAVHPRARSRRRRMQLLAGSAWNSLTLPFPSDVTRRRSDSDLGPTNRQTLNAVLTKAWPDDGKYGAQDLRELLRTAVARRWPRN